MRRAAAASAASAVLAAALLAVPPAALADTATDSSCTGGTRITQAVPALDLLQSDLAWSVTEGAGITVAVVDSGVAAAGPHLAGAVTGGVNLVPDGADPAGTTDAYGHGTAIAGQIAARRIDGSAVIGLAPEATIMPVRVFAGTDDQSVEAGFGPSTARLADGIRYAADHGAQIINVSMSTTQPDAALSDAVTYAAAHGSLVVASAGNRDSSLSLQEDDQDGPRYPAADAGALGVAAAGLDGVVTDDSIHGPQVSVSALGESILTASAVGGDCVFAADAPATSFAAAYVSAAAALVAAAHPDETPAQWAYRLEATAVRADPDARDDVSGWGLVQPYDAMILVPGSGIRGPASAFGAAAAPTPAAAAPVVVTDQEPADAAAIAVGAVAAVGGLTVLGGLGAVGVLLVRTRSRRRGAGPVRAGGLYGRASRGE